MKTKMRPGKSFSCRGLEIVVSLGTAFPLLVPVVVSLGTAFPLCVPIVVSLGTAFPFCVPLRFVAKTIRLRGPSALQMNYYTARVSNLPAMLLLHS